MSNARKLCTAIRKNPSLKATLDFWLLPTTSLPCGYYSRSEYALDVVLWSGNIVPHIDLSPGERAKIIASLDAIAAQKANEYNGWIALPGSQPYMQPYWISGTSAYYTVPVSYQPYPVLTTVPITSSGWHWPPAYTFAPYLEGLVETTKK